MLAITHLLALKQTGHFGAGLESHAGHRRSSLPEFDSDCRLLCDRFDPLGDHHWHGAGVFSVSENSRTRLLPYDDFDNAMPGASLDLTTPHLNQ